ncbi:transcription factor GTE9-like [Zingiber officinale]|uniref:transcription factor GTE9-like n=1 Tax=Zingiber officinale TaxID=94328 RepID=UPI001C4B73D3|nr:transcription factor GTE9-like [Zingiber officinale]
MGKTQKFPKGYPSSFAQEYQHVMERTGESEGFGSCAQADSEDSSALNRKCISLNVNRHQKFNIPSQLFAPTNMSKSEKKELEMRLRLELEKLQIFKKQILSTNAISGNGVALSSSSNGNGIKHVAPVQNGSGKFETTKKAPLPDAIGNSYSVFLKQCEPLLKRLMSHQYGWVFNTPVDVVKLNIPDYFQVIERPMDLGTIKTRIQSGSYSSPWDFVSDVRLTFANAKTYNPPKNDVHIMADVMSKFFESKWKDIEKKLIAAEAVARRVSNTQKPVLLPKKRKTPAANIDISKPKAVKPKMSLEEKQNISNQLASLEDMPVHILRFLSKNNAVCQPTEDEIEIELEEMNDEILFELKKLLDEHFLDEKTKNQVKSEHCEIEILNESGVSNSSMRPCKGTQPADDDVDIIDNAPPVSSYPPMEIAKESTLKSEKCSSSSDSSTDSSSSSSDSESGSSSEGESDIKVASSVKDMKKRIPSRQPLNQDRSDLSNQNDGSRIPNRTDQQLEDPYPRLDSVEAEQNLEGNNASSEKLYRAAVLKNRFADTILKAREKTLDQGEKRDPEKLRQEREELERQQREEKARLQAEAKAAEEARQLAEAEAAAQAAAEAKRKRELEREAARQALSQMEKTVEINENSLFPKDLEILKTAPGEHLPSSVGETSPDHSPQGISGFKLGGSNPLEQLGLYIKVDDEEDEDIEQKDATANGAEQGEID